MSPYPLTVKMNRTRDNKPLVSFDSLALSIPEDRTPAQLRALAGVLLRIAADCEARPTVGKHYMPARREYRLD